MKLTWLEINLPALVHNLKEVKKIIGKEVKLRAVVKADAYGHGAIEITKTLAQHGVENFAVASFCEGEKLRDAGINQSILILQPSLPDEAESIFNYRLIPSVSTFEFASELNKIAKSENKTYPVHIKVDTGMGRLGIPYNSFWKFINKISLLKNLYIEGVFSHLAKAYYDKDFSEEQMRLFRNLVRQAKEKRVFIPDWHIANSASILTMPDSYFQSVRPGIILYGLYPSPSIKNISLKPVMSFKSRIIYSKEVEAGTGLSYGHTYYTNGKSRIITVPVGYSHGYSRVLSNKTEVIFRGRKHPQVGTICMDSMLVDLGKLKPKLGEEIILIGKQGNAEISVDEIAEKMQTINYEVTCRIGVTCEKVYV